MGMEDLREIMRNTAHRTTEVRNKVKIKNSPSAWRKIWDDALREKFPQCKVTYSDRTATLLRKAVESRGLPREEMPDLLVWIVNSWRFIRYNVISLNSKVPRGPDTPNMATVIYFLEAIYAKFHQEKYALTMLSPATLIPPSAPINKPTLAAPKPVIRPYKPAYKIDHAASEKTRIRLGLKKWD